MIYPRLTPIVLTALLLWGATAHGQPADPQTDAPLSVIDWLDQPAPAGPLPRAPDAALPGTPLNGAMLTDEPAVTSTGKPPQIVTRPLDAAPAPAVGLVPPGITGIQPDLWSGSTAQVLADQISDLEESDLPAASALLFTLLLAQAAPPAGGAPAQDILTRARVRKLMELGAVDPALALVEQAGAATSPALFDLWADLSLLVGTEDTPCAALATAPWLTSDMGIRIFCAARGGDWDTANLSFGAATALSLLPRETLDALDRFLNPDLFEDAPALPMPRAMDPLTFRLYETIGEALPTGPLPRAYAVADLRDLSGWKSQLEAAERLTRVGALPDNRLLGLYTDRRPAASGGIWDRVRAVQQFDAALSERSAEAVARTLPAAWAQMREAQLEVSFATLFHDRLEDIALTGPAAAIKAEMGLLSPAYEQVAAGLSPDALEGADALQGVDLRLLRGVALGDMTGLPAGAAPDGAVTRAIYDAFSGPLSGPVTGPVTGPVSGTAPRPEWITMARNGQLGEALLATLAALHDGAGGDSRALREALGTLRALGLEDTARRAALQILLLDRTP